MAFTYGPSADVSGHLVEIRRGLLLKEFFQRRIFSPLGMESQGGFPFFAQHLAG